MLQIGEYHTLHVVRDTPPGLYLSNSDGDEVLLPHKYKPADFAIGDALKVFVYLDNEERPIATTLIPALTKNTFGYLRCAAVTAVGAFLDWGLEKQLFVPFGEQATKMKEGYWYVVYLFEDPKTERLLASSKLNKFLSAHDGSLKMFDEVSILITHITEAGANAIVEGKYPGLIYKTDIFEDIRPGDVLPAYIKKIRKDQKIDLVLQPPGYRSIAPNAAYVLEELKAAGGFLELHDNSTPEAIKNRLGLSKKSFKKAIGFLYKQKEITIATNGISLKK